MLSIKRLKIENYGGLTDKELELTNGLNVIYGKNESGKSTIRSFIHAMFYGLKNSLEKSDRKRFLPWSGGNMSGMLSLVRDGRDIEIRRTFGKTASTDKFSITDSVSGEEINGLTATTAGEALLGVSENVFLKTSYIKQGGAVTEGTDEEITARLVNLASSGDEDVSVESAISAIERAKRRLKAKNKTYSAGVIDRLSERRNTLLEERYAAKRLESEISVKRDELSELKKREKTVAEEIVRVRNLQKKQSEMASIKEGELLERLTYEIDTLRKNPILERFEGFNEEQSRELERKSSRMDELSNNYDEEQKISELEARAEQILDKKSLSPIVLGGFCISAALILFGMLFGGLTYILCTIGGIGVLLCVIYLLKTRKTAEKNEAEREYIISEITEIKKKLRASKEEYEFLKSELEKELKRLGAADIEDCRSKYREYIKIKAALETNEVNCKRILDGRDAEAVISYAQQLKHSVEGLEEDPAYAPELLDKLIEEHNRLDESIRKCSFIIENAPMASVSDIDCELKTIDEELEMFGTRLDALEIAEAELSDAFEEVRNSFGTVLNSEVNDYIKKITNGKYTEAKVSNDYKLRLVCADGSLQYASALSAGTYEQIYIALRMGIAKLICGDNIVIITDDICAQYDDERAENTMKLLKENTGGVQTIMFTCHERDVKNAERIGNINIIKIGE